MPRINITVAEKSPKSYPFPLDRKSVTLGRGKENDIPIDCISTSVKHAEMCRVEGGFELRDMGSTNGIRLNGKRREVVRLQNGQQVMIGAVAFDFELSDEEMDALKEEKQASESAEELKGSPYHKTSSLSTEPPAPDDVAAVERLLMARKKITDELAEKIVGMDQVIDELLIAIFARGHCLLMGVPGLAKTLLVSSLAECLSLSFKRIQFTPDLMPSDIIGSEILQDDPETGHRRFMFARGPVFANLVLADEINRTPPKTQAALLEAMQEKKVSVGGEDMLLDEPFFVLATQNPIEQEGTYPLPEAQLDRFFFNILVDYPRYEEEIEIVRRISGTGRGSLSKVLDRDEIMFLQNLVRRTPVADHLLHYATRLVRATRPKQANAPSVTQDWITYGAGPRASIYLIVAAKARAVLRGRYHVSVEDIQAVALPILRHRIILNFAAHSEGLTTDDVIKQLLEIVHEDERLNKKGNR
jgi:MoxR-like ATPase